MSTSDRLDQIEARADAATEGQWVVNGPDEDWAVLSSGSDSVIHAYSAHGICEGCECGDGAARVAIGIEDAEFIAHARTDVPRLVAALRAVLDLCDKALAVKVSGSSEGDAAMAAFAAAAHTAIAATLGEES